MELFSRETEKALLGAMLLDTRIAEKVITQISAGEFYEPAHQKIFTAMEMLALGKQPIDLVSVCDYLEKHDGMRKDGFQYVSGLTAFCMTTANVGSYINTVKGYAMRRAWERKAEEIKELAYNVDKPIAETYCDILSAVESTKPQNDEQEDESIKTILMDTYVKMGEKAEGGGIGIKTGIVTFDEMTGGLFPSELTIIAARPSVGKSAFAQQIAIGVARQGITVQFFSLEMAKEQYGVRVFSYDTGVNSMKMRTGKIGSEECGLFLNTIRDYSKMPLYINTRLRTPMQMRNACLNRGNVGLVIVDYLQLVRPNGKHELREQEVASVSRAFKELAAELDAPVILISSLKRLENIGKDKQREASRYREPTMQDLRESGAIEFDADNIILLHEPTEWKDPDDQRAMDDCYARGERLIKVIIEKQKQGDRCYFPLNFRPKKMEYISLLKE